MINLKLFKTFYTFIIGPNDTLKTNASRSVALAVFMFSFFVIMYYNAAVLSGLLSPTPNLITTLSQLMDSKMKFGVLDFPYFRDFVSMHFSA